MSSVDYGATPRWGLPKRWKTILFLVTGVSISYLIRVSMSVAVVKIADELEWSEGDKGLMLSAFFWGYAVGQLPSSYLASVLGAKWMFGLSILASSVLSIITPAAILSSYGLTAGLAVRALLGLGASGTFPSAFYFYPEWVPLEEKTLMITTVGSGMYLGEIVGFSVSGYLCEHRIEWIDGLNIGSWPSVFVLFGCLGVIWFPIFIYFVHSSPSDDPNITPEELRYIRKGKAGYEYEPLLSAGDEEAAQEGTSERHSSAASASALQQRNTSRSISTDIVYDPTVVKKHIADKRGGSSRSDIPWGKFFSHPASLTLLLNNWVFGWIGFMLLSEIPAYLTDSLGFELESAGVLAIAPYFANFVSSLGFGILFDWLQRKKGWTTRQVRQVAQYIAIGMSSIMLVSCSFCDDPYVAYSFMVLALFFFGAASSGIGCAFLDISPNYSSSLNTLGNTMAALAGLASPIVVAALVSGLDGVWGWRVVFFLTSVMSGLALLCWSVFQTSDIVEALN